MGMITPEDLRYSGASSFDQRVKALALRLGRAPDENEMIPLVDWIAVTPDVRDILRMSRICPDIANVLSAFAFRVADRAVRVHVAPEYRSRTPIVNEGTAMNALFAFYAYVSDTFPGGMPDTDFPNYSYSALASAISTARYCRVARYYIEVEDHYAVERYRDTAGGAAVEVVNFAVRAANEIHAESEAQRADIERLLREAGAI